MFAFYAWRESCRVLAALTTHHWHPGVTYSKISPLWDLSLSLQTCGGAASFVSTPGFSTSFHPPASTPSSCSEITHDLSTDRVVPLVWCHSKSPSKPILGNHVTGRIHSPSAPSPSTAFLPEAGLPIQFLHRSRAKRTAKKSDQRSTKSFPPKSIKIHE